MKLKALVLMGAILAMGFSVKKAYADDMTIGRPSFDLGIARSDYSISHSSVSISSAPTTTISPGSSFNKVIISNLNFGTTFFYRADGSSTAVASVGTPIFPNTKETIETNNDINVALAAGTSAKDARIEKINK